MYVEFDALPETARVWFYQAHRDLTPQEQSILGMRLEKSLESWVTHGSPMKGSFTILHNRIVILAADIEFQTPSGCSVDSSTRWLKEIGRDFDVDFFDRCIGYFGSNGLTFFPYYVAKKEVEKGDLKADSQIINHQISNLKELKSNLYISASESFIKRHFL